MKEFTITNSEKLRRIDPVILCCALGMSLLSILTLIATSDAYGTYYYKMQIAAVAVGFTAMMVMTFIDYDALISRMKYSISCVLPTAKEGMTRLPPRSKVS